MDSRPPHDEICNFKVKVIPIIVNLKCSRCDTTEFQDQGHSSYSQSRMFEMWYDWIQGQGHLKNSQFI